MPSASSNRRGRKNTPKKSKAAANLATSASAQEAPKTRLTFTFNRQGKVKEETDTLEEIENLYDISSAPADDDNESDEDIVPTSETVEAFEPELKQSRSGRTIRAPQHIDNDYVLGSELDEHVNLQSEQDGEYTTRARITSSPPVLLSRSRHNSQLKLNLRFGPTPAPYTPPSTDFLEDISETTYAIFEDLKARTEIDIDLPGLMFTAAPKPHPNPNASPNDSEDSEDDDIPEPYSALILIHLYILAHNSRCWNICDLITDTWIRAFHTRRDQARKDPRLALWRPNRVLEKRLQIDPRTGRLQHFDTQAPEYELRVNDPLLATDVLEFNPDLLNVLFNNTPHNCGARILWADALTLCGENAGEVIEMWRRQGVLHKDLKSEVLAVGLRLVRRSLTLKIEEVTEGAYCERYHEHGKNGLVCYRRLAFEERERRDAEGEIDDDVEMVDGDRF